LPLPDGQVHNDTHAIPKGNYVIAAGNYVIVTRSQVGNYVSADTRPTAITDPSQWATLNSSKGMPATVSTA